MEGEIQKRQKERKKWEKKRDRNWRQRRMKRERENGGKQRDIMNEMGKEKKKKDK